MKLKRQSRFHHEVGTGALNDIMFFLLLFFLIVATVANPQVIKLSLPQANAGGTVNQKTVPLTVTADKQYFVGSDKAPVAFENLEAALKQALAGIPDPTIVLRVERQLEVQSLVDVMELGMRLHVRMVLQTSKE